MLHGRKISCSHPSSLFSDRPCLPGHYECRAQRPNRSNRPLSAALFIGLVPCQSDLLCHKAHASTQREVGCATASSPVARLVTRLVPPNGPADARQLVSQRNRRFVVSDALLQLQSPLLACAQARGIGSIQLFCACQDRSGTMNQQRTQVHLPTLGDAAEVSSKTTARFAQRHAQAANFRPLLK